MQIKFLAHYPHFATPLAHYHYAEWHDLLPLWSYEEALTELENHAHSLDLPTTIVAVEHKQLLGSASLIIEDLPESELLSKYASLSPWLANVYVIPSRRGQGVGRALVEAIEHHAQKLKILQLYLFTEDQAGFYDRLGWSRLAQVPHQQQILTIMSKTFAP